MTKYNKILIAPLDWGLGHTTRCIPIISCLIQEGYNVTLAGNASTKKIFQQHFPQVSFIDLKGYNISYSKSKWLLPFVLFFQIPKIVFKIISEHFWLKKVVAQYGIELVISDNRYGLFSSLTKNIFITHQLTILVPQARFIQHIVQVVNHFFIKKFDQCWVPDFEKNSIAPLLSEKKMLKHIFYLGALSRFTFHKNSNPNANQLLFLLSGPEPQRTLLETKILKECSSIKGKKIIVRGLPIVLETITHKGFEIYNHVEDVILQTMILESSIIVCRSGYSTIMDLICLQKSAIIIPTPAQTEQEYLANTLHKNNYFYSISQQDFLPNAIEYFNSCSFQTFDIENKLNLKENIQSILSKL